MDAFYGNLQPAKIRHFGARALSSRNQPVSQPVSAAKFNAAGARPTSMYRANLDR